MKTKKQNCPSRRFFISSLIGISSIVVLLIVPFHSGAQNNYVDINPDTTILKGGLYNLDMNSDGTADFQISLSNDLFFQSDIITSLGDSCFVTFHMLDVCYMIEALEFNDTVAKTNFYYTIKPDHYRLYFFGLDYCMHSGFFGGQTNKYVGLKIVKNGYNYYGWLRIDVASDGTWVKSKDTIQVLILNKSVEKCSVKFTLNKFNVNNTVLTDWFDELGNSMTEELAKGDLSYILPAYSFTRLQFTGNAATSLNATKQTNGDMNVISNAGNLYVYLPNNDIIKSTSVVDMKGSVVRKKNSYDNTIVLPLKGLKSGVFALLVNGEKRNYAKKIIL